MSDSNLPQFIYLHYFHGGEYNGEVELKSQPVLSTLKERGFYRTKSNDKELEILWIDDFTYRIDLFWEE